MQNKINPAIASLIVIVLVGAATAGVAKLNKQSINESASSNINTSTRPNDAEPSHTTTSGLQDGIYASSGTYSTPGGMESIGLTVTLKNGIIEDVTLEQQASGGDTAIYQSKFASGYEPLVKGRNIEDVKLHRVAGSSLTSDGFNKALESIKRDAAA